jgi:hypothetical protein
MLAQRGIIPEYFWKHSGISRLYDMGVSYLIGFA